MSNPIERERDSSLVGELPRASSIRCQGLTIQYPRGPRAVCEVDLEVRAGEILSLIGPSGCGKTTLLRLMAGLESPTSGTVQTDPQIDFTDDPNRLGQVPSTAAQSSLSDRGRIAFVFQQPTLLPWRTALENVALPLELISQRERSQGDRSGKELPSRQPSRRERQRDAQARARASLEQLGLADAVHRYPRQLSGGMKMRVSIARALVTEPRVLLLDEPFAALDDMLRSQLGELVLSLWQQQRFTAVMVTHNIAESVLLSHRIAVMRFGRLERLLDNPLPWPRSESMRSSAEFGRFYGIVSDALRGASGDSGSERSSASVNG